MHFHEEHMNFIFPNGIKKIFQFIKSKYYKIKEIIKSFIEGNHEQDNP